MIDANQAFRRNKARDTQVHAKCALRQSLDSYFTYKTYESVRTWTMDGSGAAITATKILKTAVQNIGPFGWLVGWTALAHGFPLKISRHEKNVCSHV